MHDIERLDLVSENPLVESEEIEDEPGELTATPLKRYVTIVQSRKEGNACKWTCNFGCRPEPYTGTYSRIRAHLIGLLPGQKSQGVVMCSKVNKEDREKMKKEEAESKRAFGGSTHTMPISSIPAVLPVCKTSTSMMIEKGCKDSIDMTFSRHEVDEVIARFFYGNGIPFDVVESSFWVDMVRAINEAPKGYKPPSVEKIMTTLLEKEKTKVDQELMPLKQQWPTYGVSIVLDGWTIIKNRPFLNVMAVSEGKEMFISGIYCSGEEKSGEFIAKHLLKAIEIVGTHNVVQVLTDNAPVYKTAREIIEMRHPHIFWSSCMAHTLSILMNDIAKSMHPSLDFIGDSYKKAKTIVKYIKNHSSTIYIFQTFLVLDVIQVKKTRFGHHFLLIDHVVRVKTALINMVLSEEWEKLKTSGLKSILEHEEVKRTILDDEFWKKAETILAFTKPVWEMIRFCDSDKVFIGEVYQRMEDMLGCIRESLSNNVEIYQVVKEIVMARWNEMNLPLHSLAYVLTPYYYSKSWLTSLAPGGEKRKKPHANLDVHKTYLDALERLVKDSEANLVRQQLSDFVSNRGVFARPQGIKDRETMSAVSWWELYGVTVAELYTLAVKVLSQSFNTSCVEKAWSTYEYINSVKKNMRDANHAESLLYVHYNHQLLARYREDYEGTYKNWDNFVTDDYMENDVKDIDDREYCILHEDQVALDALMHLPSDTAICLPPQAPAQGSSTSLQAQMRQDGKRPRIE